MRVAFSFPWSAVVLPEIHFDCRTQISARLRSRGCSRILIRIVVAASCVQALADCARRPIVPDDTTMRAPIKANVPVLLPRRAPPQSQPRPDYQFDVGGRGDTWRNADNTAPRDRVTSAVVLTHPPSTAE